VVSEGGRDLDRSRDFVYGIVSGGRERVKIKGSALTLMLRGGVAVAMLVAIGVCNLVDLASCPVGSFREQMRDFHYLLR
jgi:hypothetical protein